MKLEMVNPSFRPIWGQEPSRSGKVERWTENDQGIEEVMMKTGLTSAQSLCEFLLQKARFASMLQVSHVSMLNHPHPKSSEKLYLISPIIINSDELFDISKSFQESSKSI